MSTQETQFESAKKRLSDAAARLLDGDSSAIAEADAAMAQVEDFCRHYARAREEMAERTTAKAAFTVAAQATLSGDPKAERMARNALVELDTARTDLNNVKGNPDGRYR